MKLSVSWLQHYFDSPLPLENLVKQLTMSGLEVDSYGPVADYFDSVVVGCINSCREHPESKQLNICQVEINNGHSLSIVSGADNIVTGMKVAVALSGANLPGDVQVAQRKVQGINSEGMLCSVADLGLTDKADSIFELPNDAPLGKDVHTFLQLNDHFIDIDLTPNRGDCLSVLGIAREIGVYNRCKLKLPTTTKVSVKIKDKLKIDILEPTDCPRYVGRIVKNVNPKGMTPIWMQERLRRSGIRSLSAIVDITNYVMLELGQPMHAFDLAKINGGIKVRRASDREKLTLLDGQTIDMNKDCLVIADHTKSHALAGIMGGAFSAVSSETKDIFIESVYFNPEAIMGRARHYGLHTESSQRFERGVDPELQHSAIERATSLIVEIVGGDPGPISERSSVETIPIRWPINLKKQRISRVLGLNVADKEVKDILLGLGMEVKKNKDGWQITPPSFRFDITADVDLIEEIGRVVGYDKIPSTQPKRRMEIAEHAQHNVDINAYQSILPERGYQEVITYSFVDPKLQDVIYPDIKSVPLKNPLSADLSVMRTGLWTGLLFALKYNSQRQQTCIRFFEQGLRFSKVKNKIQQTSMLAGVIFGPRLVQEWRSPKLNKRTGDPSGDMAGHKSNDGSVDFFDCKADVEALLRHSRIRSSVTYSKAVHPALHPGLSAKLEVDNKTLGWLGALHPSIEQKIDLPGQVFLFELQYDLLAPNVNLKFKKFSRFPLVRRDISIVVDEIITFKEIRECIEKSQVKYLQNVQLFDIYTGEGIDSGRKSVSLGLTLQHVERTLNHTEFDAVIENVITVLHKNLGATLRS